jgi:hypothetical protein
MTNEREAAQLTDRDAPRFDLGAPRLLVGYVVGEPGAEGMQVRGLRLATAEDVAALGC